jgi:hypothetical protein
VLHHRLQRKRKRIKNICCHTEALCYNKNMKQSNYVNPIEALSNNVHDLRVVKKLAQEWLLMNESVIYKGNLHHFQIKDLGLGICAIRLLPKRFTVTCLVKQFCLDDLLSEVKF